MNLTNFLLLLVQRPQKIQSLIDLHNLPLLLPRTPQLYISEVDKFRFPAVSSNEVQRVVMSFPSDKAPGYDKIPMLVIKDALPCILPILTLIINRSLLSSVFSSCLENIRGSANT